MKKKLFKDPLVKQISCREFYEISNFLRDCNDNNNLDNIKEPFKKHQFIFYYLINDVYYKLTQNLLIKVIYKYKFKNYGTVPIYSVSNIYVAIRDGKEEYSCLDRELNDLTQEILKHPKSKKLPQRYKELLKNKKYIFKTLPKFENEYTAPLSEFVDIKSNIVNIEKEANKQLAKEHVVLDIETNGLRSANDDVLSISIYDPYKDVAYNRFLPNELQPVVVNSYLHGIKDIDLIGKSPITQEEFDQIIDFFNLNNRTILSYSGSKFDYDCLNHYFIRHGIQGWDKLNFKNIKDFIASYASGEVTKDAMCQLLGINGVSDIHTSLNDCILEWKLFKNICNNPLVIINEHVYQYSMDYKVPITYLINYANLQDIANIKLKDLHYSKNTIYEFFLPQNLIKKIKKFDTNISGIEIEHIINTLLDVKKCDNNEFLVANKRGLKHIGSIESSYHTIPITQETDGTLKLATTKATKEEKELIDDINSVSKVLMNEITPLIDFIKENIFNGENVFSQELIFSNNNKSFGLCDLSDKNSIMEIKTFDVFKNKYTIDKIIKQLYYTSNNRKVFVLSCIFDETCNGILKNLKFIIDKLDIWE